VLGDGGAERLNNASVDVEEVVPGHAGLPGHPGGDDNDVGSLQRLPELVIPHEPLHLRNTRPISSDPAEPVARVDKPGQQRGRTRAGVLMWDTSAATPTVPAIS
jgi:hypothetical protein